MKRLLYATSLAALVATSPAMANEPAPVSGWTGLYVSAALGAGAIVHEISTPFVPGLSFNGIGGEGMFGSIGLGYDRQLSPNRVVGIFADFDFSDMTTDLSAPGFSASIEQSKTMSIGLRLGHLTSPETLWYAMAGWTRTKFDVEVPVVPISLSLGSYSGYFIGGGVESQLGRGWSIKGEYRYSDYGKESVFGIIDIEPSTHTARVGLNYRFHRQEEHHAQPMK